MGYLIATIFGLRIIYLFCNRNNPTIVQKSENIDYGKMAMYTLIVIYFMISMVTY